MECLFKKIISNYDTLVFHNYCEMPENHFDSSRNNQWSRPIFILSNTSKTEEDFKINYGNPMAGVSVQRYTLVLEKDSDKISLKFFEYYKDRKVGKIYFTKNTFFHFITYKFSTNDYYYGSIINGFKKRKFFKSLKRNYFAKFPFMKIMNSFRNTFSSENSMIDSQEIMDIYNNIVSLFLDNIPSLDYTTDLSKGLTVDEIMYKHYFRARCIKYPDNYLNFMMKLPMPSKRILKKNDYKLVDSFMYIHGMKGDKVNKVLQKAKFINESFFMAIQHLFGEKFIRHQNINDLVSIMEFESGPTINQLEHELTAQEKNNMFKILIEHIKFKNSASSFNDHLHFYKRLKAYQEDIKWKSFDGESFNREHQEWSDRYNHYKNGTYTRFYDENFVKEVEFRLKNEKGEEFFPKVLTSSIDYNQESTLQSNCVKTYVSRPGSFIISLRKDKIDSTERATVEYQIKRKNNKIVFIRVQSLGRFNQTLSFDWEDILVQLDNRIENLLQVIPFSLPKVKVEFVNRTITSDTKFVENVVWHPDGEFLTWVSPYIDSIGFHRAPPIFGDEIDDDNNIFDRLF